MTSDTSAAPHATKARPAVRRHRTGLMVERLAVPAALVILVIFFSVYSGTSDAFLTPVNIQDILANYSVTGLIALGMIVPLVAGSFDVSVAATAGVANVVMATLLATYQQNIVVAVLAALASGAFIGLINASMTSLLKLNPFITTLGMHILIGGLLLLYTQGYRITNGFPIKVGLWGSEKWLGISKPFWVLIIVALLVWFLLTQTPFGRKLAAMGTNEAAARLAGIRVDRAIFAAFVMSGVLGAMGGVMLTIRSSQGSADLAPAYLFPALAAVFLGQTAIDPGKYNVWGTIIGVYLVAVAVNGFSLMAAASWVSAVFNGAALILSVAVTTSLARWRTSRAKAMQIEAIRAGT